MVRRFVSGVLFGAWFASLAYVGAEVAFWAAGVSRGLPPAEEAEVVAGEWLETCGYTGRVVCSGGSGRWALCAWSSPDSGVVEVSCDRDASTCYLGADRAVVGGGR